MLIRRVHIACWLPKATDAHRVVYYSLLSTTTVFVRKRLNVTLKLHSFSCQSI